MSDLNKIENYIKNINVVDSNNIISLRLSQSKLYLEILNILYYIKDTNLLIITDIVKRALQITYIFNDTILISHS